MVKADLAIGEKLFSSHAHMKPVYVLPLNVEEVRDRILKTGEESADEVERQVNTVKNELEELPNKEWVDRSFQSADLDVLFSHMLSYIREKYPTLIIK